MHNRLPVIAVTLAAAGATVATALSTAAAVAPLPEGPVQSVERAAGTTFAVTLPNPGVAGRTWRVARPYDWGVVREIAERTERSGATRVTYRAIAPGATRIVYALTRGDRSRDYAIRTFRVLVTAGARCPRALLPLTANPIGPAADAALAGDTAKNRPQVTAAAIASQDDRRGAQVKAECGAQVQARTIVVNITDRALLPAQSASQRVLFVGRTRAGYRVWERAK
jgi:hypothetical protein